MTATILSFPYFSDEIPGADSRPPLTQKEVHNIAAVAYELKTATTVLLATAVINGTSATIRAQDATPLVECARVLTELAHEIMTSSRAS